MTRNHLSSALGPQIRQTNKLSNKINGPDLCSDLKHLTFSVDDSELFYTYCSISLVALALSTYHSRSLRYSQARNGSVLSGKYEI
jgi:hypothetical protein